MTPTSPPQDVALVSLSNVLYRSGFDMDALAVIHMSLEVSKPSVCMHGLAGAIPPIMYKTHPIV